MIAQGKIYPEWSHGRLEIADGIIQSLHSAASAQAENLYIAPGFIDLQLNGYDGIDYNDPDSSLPEIAASARAVLRSGVTAFCPTVITGSFDHIATCLRNLMRTAEQDADFARAMVGIHLEGPFISTEDGPRGAHPRAAVRPPDWEEFLRWQEVANGTIRIVTLSPEWPGSFDFIERAAAQGIVVAIGHTAATPARIADAVRAGARMSTHLGNGSHAKIDRHPNYIWEQLAHDDLWASFIVDGHHLPPSVVKCFLRSKGVAKSILVTDAIAAAGRPAGRYRLGDVEVEVTAERRVCLPGTPYLAGSVLEMDDAIGKTVRYSDATLAQAVQMATENPANLLGLSNQMGSLAAGQRADFVVFRWDEPASTMAIEAVIVNGQRVTPPKN
jgi:N-acetylglucosamine-6-phosphate deacetylase